MDLTALLRQMATLMAAARSAGLDSEDGAVSEMRDQIAALGPGVRDDLETLLVDPDETIAFQAALVLERMEDPAGFRSAVLYYVEHADEVDEVAEPIWYDRLLSLGARALPVVEERLAPETPFHARLAAVNLLAAIAGTGAVGRLEELTRDDDGRVAQTAAEALGRVGGPQALATLLGLLEHPDPNVRYGALEGLDLVGDPGVVERLIGTVERDHDPVIAWWPSPAAGELTVAIRASALVNRLTGQFFDDDTEAMRRWVRENLPEQ